MVFSRLPETRLNRDRIAAAAVAAGPPPTTPLTVYGANLHQWLRSDLGITVVTGVSAWADQSGKGNDAIQGTGTAQPAYNAADATIGNRPSVTGDGSNDVLTIAGLTVDLATEELYLCFIVNQVTWTSGDTWSSGSGVTMPRWSQSGASPNVVQLASASGNGNTAAALGTWVRAEGFWSATAGTSYTKIAGTTVSGGNPGTGTRTASALFAATASGFSNIATTEVIAVKTAAASGGPSGAQRAAIDAYLAALYPTALFA